MRKPESVASRRAQSRDSLRLFVACELPARWLDTLRRGREELQRALGRDAAALRWVRPEGMHLTLHFLGETPAAEEGGIRSALRHAAAVCDPFELQLGTWGTFGGRRPRVLWVGIDGDLQALEELQRRVTSALEVPADGERFSPHITVARLPQSRERGAGQAAQVTADVLERGFAAVPLSRTDPFRVVEIGLIHSRLLPGGAQYTRRFAAPLRGVPGD